MDRDGVPTPASAELVTVLINKALNVAELILKDEKYRRVVAGTPELISKVLALLEKLSTTETKMLVLRVISTLGESTDSKLEIGRHEGFRKILRLLLEGDAELTQEIVRTVRHLLDVPQVASLASASADALVATAAAASAAGGAGGSGRAANSASFLSNLVGDKLSTLLTDMGSLVMTGVSRYFKHNKDGSMRVRLSADGDVAGVMATFVPSRDVVSAAIEAHRARYGLVAPGFGSSDHLSHVADVAVAQAPPTVPPSEDAVVAAPEAGTVARAPTTPGAAAGSERDEAVSTHTQSDGPVGRSEAEDRPGDESADEVLKELMRVQGGLLLLTSTLQEAALSAGGQLDIMETISRLLFRSRENQREFRQLDGYGILQNLLDRFLDTSAPDSAAFLQDCFNIFFTIALDGSPVLEVGNMDVLRLVVRLAVASASPAVRRQALLTLQDLLAVYPLNAVHLLETGAIADLLAALAVAVHGPRPGPSPTDAAPGAEPGASTDADNVKVRHACSLARLQSTRVTPRRSCPTAT